jgi:hypothetical protein
VVAWHTGCCFGSFFGKNQRKDERGLLAVTVPYAIPSASRQERLGPMPIRWFGIFCLLHLVGVQGLAQPLDGALAARQAEIWQTFSSQAVKFNDLHLTYTQTLTSGNRPIKTRVYLGPEGILAESDFFLLAVTPNRAFALGKIRGKYTLLGLEDFQNEDEGRTKVRQVAGHLGGSGKTLLPFEATGRLTLLPSTGILGVTAIAAPKSTHLTGVRDEVGGRTVVTYKVPRPPGVDKLPQGRAVDVDGVLVLDKSLAYAVVNNEMRITSSRASQVEKEIIRYHVPLLEVGLPMMKSFEQVTTNGEGKKTTQVRVEYGDFSTERLDPARLSLDHYQLVAPGQPSRSMWLIGLAASGVLAVGYLVYRRISARRRLQS